MKVTELASLHTWIALEKDIHKSSGLDVNVFNPAGFRISEVKNWANRLCPEIKATDNRKSASCRNFDHHH